MKVLCLAVSQLILPSSTQRFPENNHTRCFHFTCLFHIALEFLADTGTKCQQLHSKHLNSHEEGNVSYQSELRNGRAPYVSLTAFGKNLLSEMRENKKESLCS